MYIFPSEYQYHLYCEFTNGRYFVSDYDHYEDCADLYFALSSLKIPGLFLTILLGDIPLEEDKLMEVVHGKKKKINKKTVRIDV